MGYSSHTRGYFTSPIQVGLSRLYLQFLVLLHFGYWLGVVEIAVGISLILPKTRKLGGYSSAALLVALYPANLYMWIYDVELGDGASLSPTGHIFRLFAQIAGIMISLWIAEWKFGERPNLSDLFVTSES